jgi:holliday junction DNA helicase RuvA
MLAYLKGTLAEKHPTRVIVDVGGVGYEVFIPLSSYDRLPAENAPVRVLTFDYVREDTHSLFGFMTEAERSTFVMLLGTTGIGPKLALSALSGMSVREIKRAILDNDIKRLSSISGIGKKTAERMIVELRDKITEGEALEVVAGPEEASRADIRIRDGVLALVALGYTQDAARRMIGIVVHHGLPPEASVEDLVKKALAGQ